MSLFKGNVFVRKASKVVTFLDMDVYKRDNVVHTKEHRKETSAESYLFVSSAHARHTFAGIVKSQLYRIRRLCSLKSDFETAIDNLKVRCLKSGYNLKMVEDILRHGKSLEGNLESHSYTVVDDKSINKEIVRLSILSGTPYEKHFVDFAKRINAVSTANFFIAIVRSTGPMLGQLLFNNSNPSTCSNSCQLKNCIICSNELEDKSGILSSSVTKNQYRLRGRELNCNNGGIYVMSAACSAQYTGKTVHFGTRMKEHLKTSKQSSIHKHKQSCNICYTMHDFKVTYVESYHDRGKYTLSEREYLWNWRVRGSINLQKTLKA